MGQWVTFWPQQVHWIDTGLFMSWKDLRIAKTASEHWWGEGIQRRWWPKGWWPTAASPIRRRWVSRPRPIRSSRCRFRGWTARCVPHATNAPPAGSWNTKFLVNASMDIRLTFHRMKFLLHKFQHKNWSQFYGMQKRSTVSWKLPSSLVQRGPVWSIPEEWWKGPVGSTDSRPQKTPTKQPKKPQLWPKLCPSFGRPTVNFSRKSLLESITVWITSCRLSRFIASHSTAPCPNWPRPDSKLRLTEVHECCFTWTSQLVKSWKYIYVMYILQADPIKPSFEDEANYTATWLSSFRLELYSTEISPRPRSPHAPQTLSNSIPECRGLAKWGCTPAKGHLGFMRKKKVDQKRIQFAELLKRSKTQRYPRKGLAVLQISPPASIAYYHCVQDKHQGCLHRWGSNSHQHPSRKSLTLEPFMFSVSFVTQV